MARKIQLFVTDAILPEYEEVLTRAKFRRLRAEGANGILALIRRAAIRVVPSEVLTVSPDEDDNRFIECAEAAEAHYLVTGNKRHFPEKWKGAAVVSARELVEILIADEEQFEDDT